VKYGVADPKLLHLDPDPACQVITYLDPTSRVIADLDQTFLVVSDPDMVPDRPILFVSSYGSFSGPAIRVDIKPAQKTRPKNPPSKWIFGSFF